MVSNGAPSVSFYDPKKIFKKAFQMHGRKVWYWFRWRPSADNNLNDYFRSLMKKRAMLEMPKGGDTEWFEKVRFTKVRGAYLPQMTRRALGRKDFKGLTPHTKVQKHLLEMDPHSTASEIPVMSSRLQLSGFIDLIRVKNNQIEILDYKPPGSETHVDMQLRRYQHLLADCLNIDPKDILIGYFNDEGYYVEK